MRHSIPSETLRIRPTSPITLLGSSFQSGKQTFCRLHFKFRFLMSSPGLNVSHSGRPSSHGCFLQLQLSSNLCSPASFHSFLHREPATPSTFFFFLQFMEMNQVCDGVIQKRKLINKAPFPSS